MIVTLTGSNSFGMQNELHNLVQAFLRDHDEMGLERIEADEAAYERLQESLQSPPFLADKKLVILRTPSLNKQFADKVETLLNGVPDTTDVILMEPKLDKRLAYYKLLKKLTDLREYAELDGGGLARWMVEEAQRRGGGIGSSDARLVVERSGAGQQALSHELDKLLAYNPAINRTAIEALIEPSPQSTVFDLLEAAFAGKGERAFALYAQQREQRVEPQQIIAMLAWQLHILALLKTAGDRSPEAVAKEAKISPYVAKKSTAVARRLSLARMQQLIADLLALDYRSKRQPINLDEALQHLLLTILQ